MHRFLRRVRVVHVELGHVDLQPERSEHMKGRAVNLHIGLLHKQMRLHSHTVDQSLFLQGLQDVPDNEIALPLNHGLIIVVKEQRPRCRVFAREFKGLQHIVVTDRLSPERLPERSVVHGLVHHIPRVDDSGIVGLHKIEHTVNIVLQTLQDLLPVRKRKALVVMLAEEPLRRLVVPDERVAAHGDAVLLREFQIRQRVLKCQSGRGIVFVRIVLIGLFVEEELRLRIVLAGEAVELLTEELHLRGCIKIAAGNGCADLEIGLVCGL